MLIPQFSIRWLLGLTTVAAVFFSIVAFALRGHRWALGFCAAVGALGLLLLVCFALFVAVGSISWVSAASRRRRDAQAASPFAPAIAPAADPPPDRGGPTTLAGIGLALWLGMGGAAFGQMVAAPPAAPAAPVLETPARGGMATHNLAGILLSVDTRFAGAGGYWPMQFTFTPTAPVVADRSFVVQVDVEVTRTTVRQQIDIPSGSGPVRATVAAPIRWPHGSCEYRVFEGDKAVVFTAMPGGGTSRGVRVPSANFYANAVLPRFLWIADRPIDTSTLAQRYPDASAAKSISGNRAAISSSAMATLTGGTPDYILTAMRLPPGLAYSRWIDYTGYDVVGIALDDLAKLRANSPAQFTALTRWTSAGGNLFVWGVGPGPAPREQLEDLLGMKPGSTMNQAAASGWRPVSQGVTAAQETPQRPGMSPVVVETPKEEGVAAALSGLLTRTADMAVRPHQLGQVIATPAANPFPGSAKTWDNLIAAVGLSRMNWDSRHGIAPDGSCADYWSFLIPGVGLAPVVTFEILISVFVLAIGPANYFLLRRWKRLSWLIVTVPGAALLVTAALFAYAMVADGLGVRLRARTYTEIDQRSGEAACWSWLSYYAGLAPSGGLSFADDVAVHGVEPIEHDVPRNLEVQWDDRQRLIRGGLPPRTPTQFLTVRSRATAARLDLAPSPEGGWTATNRLGTRVAHLLVRAGDGRYYYAEDVAEGAAVRLAAPIADIASGNPLPAALRGANPASQPAAVMQPYYRGRYYGPRFYGSGNRAAWRGNVLETQLGRLDSNTAGKDYLQPGSYAALVDRSPEVEHGVAGAREEASLHVIVGRW